MTEQNLIDVAMLLFSLLLLQVLVCCQRKKIVILKLAAKFSVALYFQF